MPRILEPDHTESSGGQAKAVVEVVVNKREKAGRVGLIRQHMRECRAWLASAEDALRAGDYDAAAVRCGFGSDEAKLASSGFRQLGYDSESRELRQVVPAKPKRKKRSLGHGDVYPAGDGTWRYNGD